MEATVNDTAVELDENGAFALHRSLPSRNSGVTFTAELNGRKKTLTRRFRMRAVE
jgi:hypothetical protein